MALSPNLRRSDLTKAIDMLAELTRIRAEIARLEEIIDTEPALIATVRFGDRQAVTIPHDLALAAIGSLHTVATAQEVSLLAALDALNIDPTQE